MIGVLLALLAPGSTADVVSLSAGPRFTCAAHADGTVSCWGDNDHGQLGDGTTKSSTVPVRIAGITDAVEVATDDYRTCVRKKAGTIACFGKVSPTNERATRPVAIPASDVVQIAGSCWRSMNGTATCLTTEGQAHALVGVTDAVDIASKSGIGCIARKTGAVACWFSPTDVRTVRGIAGAVDVAVADEFACARTKTGATSCWNWGFEGPEIRKRPVPRPQQPKPLPQKLVRPVRIAGVVATVLGDGRDTICAATARDVRCWDALRRVTTTKLAGVKLISGDWHRCALLQGRDIACWGPGTAGELGFGWGNGYASPIAIPGVTDVVEVMASFIPTNVSQFTCARRRNASVVCWGDINATGTSDIDIKPRELFKNASRLVRQSNPAIIDAKGKWTMTHHTMRMPPLDTAQGDCAITTDARVLCTGEHRPSNDNLNNPAHPDGDGVQIANLADVTKLAVGGNFACALRRIGRIACFRERDKLVIEKLTDVKDVASGTFAMCALSSGTVWCKGQKGSWLLDGNPLKNTGDSDWRQIAGLTNVTAISVGYDHACAVKTDNTVACFGNNEYGQLGDGTMTSRTTVAAVPKLANVTQVSAGTNHTCAVHTDASVSCWGDAQTGAIGTYTMIDIKTPTRVTW